MEKYIKAKKSLGQNFLIDPEALSDISTSIEVSGKHIIEVGPGYGALTEYLIHQKPRQLDLIELDTDMIEILEERQEKEWKAPNFSIHHQDVLKFIPISSPYSVIANIPYYITSPILFHFLYPKNNWWNTVKNGESEGATLSERGWKQQSDERQQSESEFVDPSGAFGTFQSWKVRSFPTPESMVIMMQKEVGEKILEGRARKPHHSFLSLAMELACDDIEIVRYVGKASFNPAPKVDSIVLKFSVRSARDPMIESKLLELWKVAFTHPRKTLLANLKWSTYDIETIKKTLTELGYDERVRAEAVKMEDWEQCCYNLFSSSLEPNHL